MTQTRVDARISAKSTTSPQFAGASACIWLKPRDALCVPLTDEILDRIERLIPRKRDREEDGPQIGRGTKVLDLVPGDTAPPGTFAPKEAISSLLPMPDGTFLVAARNTLASLRREGAWESFSIAIPEGANSIWPQDLIGYQIEGAEIVIQLTGYVGYANPEPSPAPKEIYIRKLWQVRLRHATTAQPLELQPASLDTSGLTLPACLSDGTKCLRVLNNKITKKYTVDIESATRGVYGQVPLLKWTNELIDARWSVDGKVVHVIADPPPRD